MIDLARRTFQRILLIKPSSPGDIIHALPVLHGLRRRYADAHIAWLVASSFANLIETDPALNEAILFDRRRFGRLGRSPAITREFAAFLRGLRQRRFDLVVDLQGLFRSGFFTRATGAPVRIGFAAAREFAWMFYTHRIAVGDRDAHAADKNYAVASLLGFADAPMDFTVAITDDDRRQAAQLVAFASATQPLDVAQPPSAVDVAQPPSAVSFAPANSRCHTGETPVPQQCDTPDTGLPLQSQAVTARFRTARFRGGSGGGAYAILVPGTRWETKCWPPERFGQLARTIRECHGHDTYLVGGADDVPVAEAAVAASNGAAVNVCGRTTLRQLAALIEQAAIVVTADSTPMHLAAALGRPLVALFGPTNPRRTGPYGRLPDVLRLDLPCSPCYFRKLHQCPHAHACMEQLSVDAVAAAVAARLNRRASASSFEE